MAQGRRVIGGPRLCHGGRNSASHSAWQNEAPQGHCQPPCRAVRCGPEYPTTLWKNYKAQIEDTQELDLSNKPRSGRPSMLAPTKAAARRAINSENRAFTNGQVSDRLKELGLDFSEETVRRWFEKRGGPENSEPHQTLPFRESKEAPDRLCLLYTSPSPRDGLLSRMPSSA